MKAKKKLTASAHRAGLRVREGRLSQVRRGRGRHKASAAGSFRGNKGAVSVPGLC